jgi:hypothetical protein
MEVRVERHLKADVLNAIANDPDVRPWIAPGREPLDLSFQVENRNNILLVGEHGCCMFLRMLPGVYEVHTQVRKEGRGEWTNALAAECVRQMFLRTDAYEIMTRVPKGHLGAKTAAVTVGMRYDFTREKECRFRDTLTDVHIYSFRLQDWLPMAPASVSDTGRRFHDRLHEEAERLGVKDPSHADDENHNLFVGAAVEMVQAGYPVKAALTYNRWAIASRHEPIALISVNPTVAKIDHGLYVTFADGDIRVSLP